DEAMNGRCTHIRAGLIVGPNDTTDRFTYWPVRIARGGEVLAPGKPDLATQFIDVRDLAAFAIKATEEKLTGPFNCTGPDYALSMKTLFETCKEVSNSDASFTWVEEPFLVEQEVGAFVELPLWIPEEYTGFNTINNDKAHAAGLTYRPLRETVADTISWEKTRPADYEWRGGLKPEREAELLKLWRESH
ncbi:MAG: epimerase, partial [Chloroflexota bacterium]